MTDAAFLTELRDWADQAREAFDFQAEIAWHAGEHRAAEVANVAAPTFALPGSHYRGFPTVACCDGCKARVQAVEQVGLTYRGQPYIVSGQRTYASPF